MKKLYFLIAFLVLFLGGYFSVYSQISWVKNSGSPGAGSFTISGNGSINSLSTDANIALAKHGSGNSIYYSCNNCTINIQITGQLIVDYPVYLTNSRIIIGKPGFSNITSTAGLFVNGNALNPRQALFLDNASSIQLASSTNFIKLQNSPTAYIYINYSGQANSAPASGARRFAGTDNSPLCGLASTNGAHTFTCDKGQENGPAILNASGFSVIAPLPVVLVDFSANLNSNKTIGLGWSTQMEVNLSYFTIERSADGSNWEFIGKVQANGNSGIVSYYSFTDQKPLGGFNYYRLQMTDLDNKSGFTEIKLVRTPVVKLFNIFPNPSGNYVDVTLNKTTNGNIRLLNQFGQVLQQKQVTASNNGTTLSFQLFGYPPGNYFVQVIGADGSQETGKLIIVR